MTWLQSLQGTCGRRTLSTAACVLGTLVFSCTGPAPKSSLPPSASDLPLLQSERICVQKASLLRSRTDLPSSGDPWGTGEELRLLTHRGEVPAEESYFIDEDGLLVGFFISFPQGLPLKPYPVLRDTLSQLKPTVEFYWNLAGLSRQERPETTALYMTGDEKSTTQYLVTGDIDSARLVSASLSIDPYSQLMSPYRREFLNRLTTGPKAGATPAPRNLGSEDRELFAALQQFARGETALLAYCGTRDEAIASEAYQQAIAEGLSSKNLLAEAHHKLGLSLKSQGDLEGARDAMEQALKVLPGRPDVLNNLGDVYKQAGDRQKALAAFERAVSLKPNYPIARFNLAEVYETVNVRRAIAEYETYLALSEGIPEEAERADRARQRLKVLTR